jgi:hypothetical protein
LLSAERVAQPSFEYVVVLAQRLNSARLWTLVALGFHETNLTTNVELVERSTEHGISVEVDLSTIRCLDETVLLLGRHEDDPPMRRDRMDLGLTPLPAGIILELTAHSVKGISHHNISVFVGMLVVLLVTHHKLPAGHAQLDPEMKQLALMPVPVRRLEHDATAHDAGVKLLQLRCVLPNESLERFRLCESPERDL